MARDQYQSKRRRLDRATGAGRKVETRRMRGVTVTLPPAAQSRLQTLQMMRMAAEDGARSIHGRINNLPRDDQMMRDKLAAEQQKLQHRFGILSQLLSRVNQFLMELKGVTLEMAPAVSIELKNSET